MIILNILLLIVGFIALVKGADIFVEGSSNLAKALKIPTLIIGLTIVAFGTSAPECAVSVIASLKGNSDIAIGNVVGSCICNTLLVLGIAGLFGNLACKKKIIERDFTYSILSNIILIIMCSAAIFANNSIKEISRTNGALLICFLIIYVYSLLMDAKNTIRNNKEKNNEETLYKLTFKDILFIILGLIGIVGGGELVVNNATSIAKIIGISDRVIALTVVAVGTSLPEIVTSVIAVKKGENDIALGNVIGSNIFNIFMILGLSSIAKPLTYTLDSYIDMIIMLAASILVFVLFSIKKKLSKKECIVLLISYIAYIGYLMIR